MSPTTGSWIGRELIGRDAELAMLAEALREPALLTLVGPGGVGKTSLALAIAGRVEAMADPASTGLRRAVLIDLAAANRAASVPGLVATALGAREIAGGDLSEAIARQLAGEPSLVILDNLEHLLEAGAFIGWLAAHAGASRILVTSRAASGVPGERLMTIAPLGLPSSADDVAASPSGALFLARARRQADGVEPADLDAIGRVCAALDGLPLAIELAAAWSTVLTPRAIERRLRDGDLLASDRDPNDRHASLERVIASSLELVDDRERTAFDRLAVFAGPFDDRAAQAVIGEGALGILRALGSLSLVHVAAAADGEPRFRLLETVRAVARRRLERDPNGRREALIAHAAWYERRAAAAANRLRDQGFGDPVAVEVLQDPNNQAALDVAMELGVGPLAVALATWPMTLAIRTGLFSEPMARLERALALGPVPPDVRADALNSLVAVRVGRGDPPDPAMVALAEAAVAAAREIGDQKRLSRTLVTLGHLLPPAEAISRYEAGAAAAHSVGYAWMVANANLNLAWRHHQLGKYRESLANSEQALDAAREAESPLTAADALTSMADAWVALGEDAKAIEAYTAVLPLLRERAGAQFVSAPLMSLAVLAARARDRDTALGHLAEIVRLAPESESADARNDLAVAGAIVLADRHPIIAAHGLALERSDLTMPHFRVDIARARSEVERRLGAPGFERALRAGRTAGVRALAAEVEGALDQIGPAARARLRATYETFTPREEQVLRLLADGRSDPEIADELGMSAKTASVHVGNIKAKLGLDSRVEAALEARRMLDRLA